MDCSLLLISSSFQLFLSSTSCVVVSGHGCCFLWKQSCPRCVHCGQSFCLCLLLVKTCRCCFSVLQIRSPYLLSWKRRSRYPCKKAVFLLSSEPVFNYYRFPNSSQRCCGSVGRGFWRRRGGEVGIRENPWPPENEGKEIRPLPSPSSLSLSHMIPTILFARDLNRMTSSVHPTTTTGRARRC